MSQRKRARDEDNDLQIKVSSGQFIGASSLIVRIYSSAYTNYAVQFPAGAQEWDVSGFLINGRPYSLETVQCWVNCAYAALHSVAELDEEDIAQLSTVNGLHQVLSFADAVGSPQSVCSAACSQLDTLKFVVQLPEQVLQSFMKAGGLQFLASNLQLVCCSLSGEVAIGDPLASEQQKKQVRQEIAAQTGDLLHMAHKLRLSQLQDALHNFIRMSARWAKSDVLFGMLKLVFTDEVLAAALGTSTLSKEVYINSVLTMACSFSRDVVGCSNLMAPLGNPSLGSTDKVKTVLQGDFAGATAGSVVTTKLDLYAKVGGCMNLWHQGGRGHMTWPVQLLMGPGITAKEDYDALMTGEL